MLKIIQFSDTHLFDDTTTTLKQVNTWHTLQRCVQHAQQKPFDLVLVTGDLTHDGGQPAYQHFREAFSGLRQPVLVLPGNHDDLALMRASFDEQMQPGFHQAGRWQFILLDSLVAGEVGGRLSDQELTRLDTLLTAHHNLHTMVCIHHHAVPVGSEWLDSIMLANAEALFAVLERHPQVRAVTWGHIHQPFHGRHKEIELFGTPSTCIQFKPAQADFATTTQAPGYRWFHLADDGGISTQTVYLEAEPAGR